MFKRLLLSLLAICLVLTSFGQNGLEIRQYVAPVVESTDPSGDSLSLVEVRQRLAEIKKTRPTVALVLSGGGAKGAAHVGVLKYLEERKIPVDVVLGTSMGGLMGGLYSLGHTPAKIDSILRSVDWFTIMSDDIPTKYYSYEQRKFLETYAVRIPFHYEDIDWQNKTKKIQKFSYSLPGGYLYGLNVYNMLSSLAVGYEDEMKFKDLPIPYFTVSTDMVSMNEKNWFKGDLVDAMRSTMSIPFIFKPVKKNDMILVDGGTRNNFPVDIARSMGADYVIGVDLDKETKAGDLNNAIDLLFQTFSAMGIESYRINSKDVDIYIRPDMTEFGMLSFGKEEIARIIDNGYQAAHNHYQEFDELLKKLGGEKEKTLASRPATDVGVESVMVNMIEIAGLSDKEASFISHRIGMKVGNAYSKKDIEKAVARIFSTGSFTSVTYRLLGKEEPYKLVFICEKGPIHQLAFGLRGDTEIAIAALVNLGLGYNRVWGPKFDATLKLGESPYAKFEFAYVPERGPKFGLDIKVEYTNYKTFSSEYKESFQTKFQRNDIRFYIKTSRLSKFELKGGVKFMNMPFYRVLHEDRSVTERNRNSYYLTSFAELGFNTQDETYFPRSGVNFFASYDYLINGKDYNLDATQLSTVKGNQYIRANIDLAVPIFDRFTVLPSVGGRIIFGEVNQNRYMYNYAGGAMPGRYYEHQLSFIGYNGLRECMPTLISAQLALRVRIGRNLFISALGNMLQEGENIDGLNPAIYAVGAGVGYRTRFGPIRGNIHWCSETNSFGAYLGMGFDF